jgi:cullin 1
METFVRSKFIQPLINFLNTGVNTINAQAYLDSNEAIMKVCDANNNQAFKSCHEFSKTVITEYCQAISHELLHPSLNGEELLVRYVALWMGFKSYTHSINKLFSYLNRHWLGKDNKLPITEECMVIWREVANKNISTKIVNALVVQINRDRSGEETKRETLKQVIKSFKDMGMKAPKTLPSDGVLEWNGEVDLTFYGIHLIDPLAEATKKFYQGEARKWNAQENCPDYIDLINEKLEQEDDYVSWWLDTEGGKKVV